MRRFAWRMASWAMVVALLPSLLFLGHWGFSFAVTGGRVVLLSAHDDDQTHGEGGDEEHHHQHCHGDAGSCSDVPFGGASAFALLREWADGLCGGFADIHATVTVTGLAELHAPSPEERPPRRGSPDGIVLGWRLSGPVP